MKESIVAKKSVEFAILVIQTYKMLCEEKREFVMSKQFLKSGTSIGAQIKEAEHAQSRADFLHKMNIALKEANETGYWLLLLKEGKYLSEEQYAQLTFFATELIRLLASIVKTTKGRLKIES